MGQDIPVMLTNAGLEVVGQVERAGRLRPFDAWKRVVDGTVVPTNVIGDESDVYLQEIDDEWFEVAERCGLFGAEGTFLVSVAGQVVEEDPWFLVRISGDKALAGELVQNPGEPDFVTAAVDGHVLVSVTTEEDGFWIVRFDVDEAS
ncbi:hypothetical protein ACFVUS_37180 [Nocardia sp. NPDC058058]|uniref:hypothetical protein n=1 Tax=Nocardia sp. NPDC058058 TaxID=3346317 RepID=UPI0036D86ABC